MRTQNFAEWMLKIKSIHYANDNAMTRAFQRFRNPNLKTYNYQFK
jgi:hypothetical protein